MRIRVFSVLLLFSITGCSSYSENLTQITSTPISSTAIPATVAATLTPVPRPSYDVIVLNSPPSDIGLPELSVAENGTLVLISEKGTTSEYSRGILNTNSGCFVDTVTATYSPDYRYITVAKRCMASEGYESVYLVHSNGVGLVRTIVGYDSYESGTNRSTEWSPDSKSLIYFRSAGFSDAHIEVFTGIFRYEIETAERKYLAPLWGQYKWSPNGKWIAVLDARSNTECKNLYLLDAYGETLWELDSICANSDVNTEIVWQQDVLVILQKERENQTIISTKEYETEELSSYKQVTIK